MRQLLVVLVGVTYLKEKGSSYKQMVWNVHTVLKLILTSISAGTGPNETWSVPAIFNPYMYLFWLSQIFYESLYLYLRIEMQIFSLHWMVQNIRLFNVCEARRVSRRH